MIYMPSYIFDSTLFLILYCSKQCWWCLWGFLLLQCCCLQHWWHLLAPPCHLQIGLCHWGAKLPLWSAELHSQVPLLDLRPHRSGPNPHEWFCQSWWLHTQWRVGYCLSPGTQKREPQRYHLPWYHLWFCDQEKATVLHHQPDHPMCADHIAGYPGVLSAIRLWGENDTVYLSAASPHCVPATDIKDSAAHLSSSATHRSVLFIFVCVWLCKIQTCKPFGINYWFLHF